MKQTALDGGRELGLAVAQHPRRRRTTPALPETRLQVLPALSHMLFNISPEPNAGDYRRQGAARESPDIRRATHDEGGHQADCEAKWEREEKGGLKPRLHAVF